jgi:Putative transposase
LVSFLIVASGAAQEPPSEPANQELSELAAAVDESQARPGRVAVIQTFGSSLKRNPHIHAIVTRGVFLDDGSWLPIPFVDSHRAELLFRHKVLGLLRDRDLITQNRIDLLLSWRNSGFAVHNRTSVYPSDTDGLHRLACYLMRPPVNLSRLRYHPDSRLFVYEPKAGQKVDEETLVDLLEFLARVLIHIPEPQKHLVRFYGVYANRIRAIFWADDSARAGADGEANEATSSRTLRGRWAELILPYLRGRPSGLPPVRGQDENSHLDPRPQSHPPDPRPS